MRILFSPHVKHYTVGLCNELIHENEVNIFHHENFNLPIKAILPTNKLARKLGKLILYKSWFKKFDIFHCNSPIEAKRAKAKRGLVLTIHGNPCPELVDDAEEKTYLERIKGEIISASKKGLPIVTVSKYLSNVLKESCDVEATSVIYHGLLPMFMSERPREWKDKHTILWISRFVHRKKPFDFLKALSLIKDENFKAIMLGGGPLEKRLNRLVDSLSLDDKISVLKAVSFEEMANMYRCGTIYVHTNPAESFGFALLEAMGSGLPVVVPNSGGASEIAGEACLKFRDSDELADKILILMNSPKLYRKLSKKALRRAGLFTWEKAANEYLKLYRKSI